MTEVTVVYAHTYVVHKVHTHIIDGAKFGTDEQADEGELRGGRL